MPDPTAVNWEPAPQKDFEAEAFAILWVNPDGTPVETKKEDPAETPKKEDETVPKEQKEEPKDEPKKEQIKEDEELKIPRSRLNKEIEKRKISEEKVTKLEAKLKAEIDRINSLTDEEKEEQSNLTRLGMDTRKTKLEDMLEEMKDQLAEANWTIKELEGNINEKETAVLSARISELTKKYDGTDWLPKFDIWDLIEFSKEENYLPKDPLKLYEMKYRAEIYAKQYQKKSTEVDKGNKETFAPQKKSITFKDWDENFEAEAKAILEGIGGTT